ncbi:MAG: hypothetical protein ACLQJR_35125 [Stellaceae bacterium]
MRNLLRLGLFVLALLPPGACTPAGRAPGESEGASTPANDPTYEQALARWVDRPEEDLVAAWGVPERSQHLTDGGQALEYRHLDATGKLLCATLFTSDVYGMIRLWTYHGTDCRAPRLGDYNTHS